LHHSTDKYIVYKSGTQNISVSSNVFFFEVPFPYEWRLKWVCPV